MSEENEAYAEQKRLFQVDIDHLDYRVTQLENEQFPKRVAQVEFVVGQLQGEVTAVKEIARSIGVKLDAGVQEIKNKHDLQYQEMRTKSDMQFQELKSENVKNQSFIKGILWAGGGLVAFIQLSPLLSEIVQKLIGAK